MDQSQSYDCLRKRPHYAFSLEYICSLECTSPCLPGWGKHANVISTVVVRRLVSRLMSLICGQGNMYLQPT